MGFRNRRTFNDDLMRGEGRMATSTNQEGVALRNAARGENAPRNPGNNGAAEARLFTTYSGADPSFYQKKRECEARLGRELSTAEFVQNYYVAPDSSTIAATGTSIFDPVLTELVYRWFSPPDATILDPFAGGSVRGIVASKLGRRYVGVELRDEQVAANREQARTILSASDPAPVWHQGDSRNIVGIVGESLAADLIFSCPPYANLEVYSDDPADISNKGYDEFLGLYREIIAAACSLLKPNRYAAFVVGEVRGRDGFYHGFVADTIRAFQDAGLGFYNEAILITLAGSLPIRVGAQFAKARKFGKTHQNLLVFAKGDGRAAADACGPIEVASLAEMFGVDVAETMAATSADDPTADESLEPEAEPTADGDGGTTSGDAPSGSPWDEYGAGPQSIGDCVDVQMRQPTDAELAASQTYVRRSRPHATGEDGGTPSGD